MTRRIAALALMFAAIPALRLTSVHAASVSTPEQACTAGDWVSIGGVGDGVTALAGSNEFEFMFAGSFTAGANHMWRGTPDDPTWLAVPDLGQVPVTSIAVGPGVEPRVWAGERGGGVYRSDNGGATFRASGLPGHSITALLSVTSTVLAAASSPTMRGIYGWDEASDSWQLRGGDQIASLIFYVLGRDAMGSLWLGTEANGLWRSDDAGVNWSRVSLSGQSSSTVISFAADPQDPLRLFVGHGRPRASVSSPLDQKGAQVSRNGGVSWDPILAGVTDVTGLAPLATDAGVVYAAGWGIGLFASFDGGRVWNRVPGPGSAAAPDAAAHLESLAAVSPRGTRNCELLLAGGADGLWARNVSGVRYHHVYLPSARCQNAHCAAVQAHDASADRPLRLQVAP